MAKKKGASGLSAFLLANLFTFDGVTVVRYHSVVLFLLLRLPQVLMLGYLVMQIVYSSAQFVERFKGEVFLSNTLNFGGDAGAEVKGIADVGAGTPARVNGTYPVVNTGLPNGGWVASLAEDAGSYIFVKTAFYEERQVFTEVDGVYAWRRDPTQSVVKSLMVMNVSLLDEIHVETVARMRCTLPQDTLRWKPFGSEEQTHIFSNFKSVSKWVNGNPPPLPYNHALAYTTVREMVLVALGSEPGSLSRAEEDTLIENEILKCHGGDSHPNATLEWGEVEGDTRGPCMFTAGATLSLLTTFDCNFNLLENGSKGDGRYGCKVKRNLDALSSSSTTQEVAFIYSSSSNSKERRKQFFGGIRVELRGSGDCSASTVNTVNQFVSALVSYMVIAYTAVFAISVYLLTPEAYAIQFSHYEDPPTRPDTYFQSWYDKMRKVKHIVDFTRKKTETGGTPNKGIMSVITDGGQEEDEAHHRTFKSVVAANRLGLKNLSAKRKLDEEFNDEAGGGEDPNPTVTAEIAEDSDDDTPDAPPPPTRTWREFFAGVPRPSAQPKNAARDKAEPEDRL